ncbi:MAG: hypothetical protein ACO2ZL_09530, partial [Flavobacteriales bacterium]
DIHRNPKEAFEVVKSLFTSRNRTSMKDQTFQKTVYETSRNGGRFHEVSQAELNRKEVPNSEEIEIRVHPQLRKQRIEGFGGSFTDASAYLVHQMSPENRKRIMEAYFAEHGANYSLTRTHMNSCDFSRFQYSYAPVEGDLDLAHFDIQQDLEFLFPMIKEAQEISKEGFNLIASPWTAPPWMKDNNDWVGGRLRKEINAAHVGSIFCQIRSGVSGRRHTTLGLYGGK